MSQAIYTNPQILELYRLLTANGHTKETQTLMTMVASIGDMEEQHAAMRAELQELKQQVEKLQDKGIRAGAKRIVSQVEEKVSAAHRALSQVKNNLYDRAGSLVQQVKESGSSALNGIATALQCKKGLTALKGTFEKCQEAVNKAIQKLSELKAELHEMKGHAKNAGRILAGKETKEQSPTPDRGAIHQMQRALGYMGNLLIRMIRCTEKTVGKLDTLEQRTQITKTSVRSEMNDIKRARLSKQEQRHSAIDRKPQEQAR